MATNHPSISTFNVSDLKVLKLETDAMNHGNIINHGIVHDTDTRSRDGPL